MFAESLSIAAIRLDQIQRRILEALYARSERRRETAEIARLVFPAAMAYPDAELRGIVQPRLHRMAALGVVTVNRLGAAISLKGIALLESGSAARA